MIRELILNYYDKICAQIRTKDWTSDMFKSDIGLFQGCVSSCILFFYAFQLLLDMVTPWSKKRVRFQKTRRSSCTIKLLPTIYRSSRLPRMQETRFESHTSEVSAWG